MAADRAITKRASRSLLALLGMLGAMGAMAEPPEEPAAANPLRRIVGQSRTELVRQDDTLLDIAVRHGVGFDGLARLNSEVDTWIPVPGTIVRIPSRVILPNIEEKGLVINIPEMRLFDFTVANGPEVIAAAVGDAEDATPTGIFEIRDKRVDPVWNVPISIQREKPELPQQVPPGPENPLGSRWMRIGNTSSGIHGTNARWSIGREATHGCVRLYEVDIQRLFERTSEGTRLEIVYQPYKWGH
ncbi:MAG: L,D-transpeptidase family protein, partial [Myxococcales bacterium]|nr:L,D-transpeptidase family protein [Myxococcales bacterium]